MLQTDTTEHYYTIDGQPVRIRREPDGTPVTAEKFDGTSYVADLALLARLNDSDHAVRNLPTRFAFESAVRNYRLRPARAPFGEIGSNVLVFQPDQS